MENTTEMNEKLKKLLSISLYLGSTLNLYELLKRIISVCKEVLNSEDASLILYDEKEEKLYFYEATNEFDVGQLKKIVLNLGQGIAGHVASTLEGLIVNDAQNEPRHDKTADRLTGKTTRNLIAIPVLYQNRLVGVMEAINKIDGDFIEEDLKIATSLGNMAAVALENAKLHEETKNNLEKIKELETAKTEFISILSHELKTPLTPIRGYIDLLLAKFEKLDAESVKTFLETIKNSASHLNMIINDLFIVNEVDVIRTNRDFSLVDIRNIIQEQIEYWEKEKGTHPVVFEITGEDMEKFKLNVDHLKIGHCLFHIMDNAGKFSEPGNEIKISLSSKELNGKEYVQIVIKDNGIGIAQEHHEKIFDKFFQISGGLTRKYEGLGIGLFICKKIVEFHDGKIYCKSEAGKGSGFHIELPVK
jgi:signal transduction histidine kinase